MVYNAMGEVLSQTDGASNTTTLTYDLLGRKLTQSVSGLTSTWVYDTGNKGIGKLASVTSSNGVSKTITYDNLGRFSSQTQVVGGESFVEQHAYDTAGRLDTLTYPTGFATKNIYNVLGYRTEVRNAATNAMIWRADAVSAAGMTDESFGNGTGVTRDYQSNTYRENRISHVRDSDNALLQRWEYSYDLVGNTTQRKEIFGNVTENFTYDVLNRLVDANTSNNGKVFNMDGVGNLFQKTDVFDTPSRTGVYSYQGFGPHAMNSIAQHGSYNPPVFKYFGYTAAGAASGWDGMSIANTAFNLPGTISKGGNHTFTYDESYQRVKYATPTNARVYLRSAAGPTLYERDQPTSGSAKHRLFIFGAGRQPVAQLTIVGTTSQWHYLHHDRLGSITLITDQSAQAVERHYFDPYGKRRNVNGTDAPVGGLTSALTSRGFTGHEHLDELNLIHMNGRVYDPYIGKFLSADPVLHTGALAQGMNRYSYVLGNPMSYTDPSGFEGEPTTQNCWFICGRQNGGRTVTGLSYGPGMAHFDGSYYGRQLGNWANFIYRGTGPLGGGGVGQMDGTGGARGAGNSNAGTGGSGSFITFGRELAPFGGGGKPVGGGGPGAGGPGNGGAGPGVGSGNGGPGAGGPGHGGPGAGGSGSGDSVSGGSGDSGSGGGGKLPTIDCSFTGGDNWQSNVVATGGFLFGGGLSDAMTGLVLSDNIRSSPYMSTLNPFLSSGFVSTTTVLTGLSMAVSYMGHTQGVALPGLISSMAQYTNMNIGTGQIARGLILNQALTRGPVAGALLFGIAVGSAWTCSVTPAGYGG